MSPNQSKLESDLEKRNVSGSLRSLKNSIPDLVDFSSNDYLGLARNATLKQEILTEYQQSKYHLGSTGSRLLTGNNVLIDETESYLANLFESPRALVFNSGYMASLAFFSTIPSKNSTILYDELIHACVKDGCRLSLAKKHSFRHNDLNHLEDRLKNISPDQDIIVVVESIYSMDGDSPNFNDLVDLCDSYSAKLVVDEAHSTGVCGENGNGMIANLGLQKRVYARIMTFGKAIGSHGACICGNETLINYLINFARPFIYTTAPGAFEVLSIKLAFEYLRRHPNLIIESKSKVDLFRKELSSTNSDLIESSSLIQALRLPGNSSVKALSMSLKETGFDARPILAPTVKEGSERLRICIHTFNSDSEIMALCQQIDNHFSL